MSNAQSGCTRNASLLGRNLDEVWHQLFPQTVRGEDCGFAPRMNVAETDEAFELAFDLPGIAPDGIQIEYHENVLTVSGERKLDEDRTANRKFHRVEQRMGKFRRSVRLPEVDGDRISARFAHGELVITAPKIPAAVARKIPVQMAQG